MNGDGRMVVFAVRNGVVQHRSNTAVNGNTWNSWYNHGDGSGTKDVAAAEHDDGELEVIRVTASGTVRSRTQSCSNCGFDAWATLNTTGARERITAEQNADGRLVVFALADCGASVFGSCDLENIAQTAAGADKGWATSWTLRDTEKEVDIDAALDSLDRIVIATRSADNSEGLVVAVQKSATGSPGGYSTYNEVLAWPDDWFDAITVEIFKETPYHYEAPSGVIHEWGPGPRNDRVMVMTGDDASGADQPTEIYAGSGTFTSPSDPVPNHLPAGWIWDPL